MDWPSPLKNKGVFFVKREKVALPEEMSDLLNWMCCGDIHPNPLDQFCGIVEEVYNPIFSCYHNMIKFPHCVSDDIRKQNHELASTVHQIRGHIKGRTLLPFPQQGTAAIEDEEAKVRATKGKEINMMLKNTIEGIILKWAHQVEEVLGKDSSQVLEDGDNPGPLEEIKFWDSKKINLESLFEQMKAPTTRKMASILNIETLAEIEECTGVNKLTPVEVRSILRLRVDFKPEEIKRVKLS